jgi:hypothetical protein
MCREIAVETRADGRVKRTTGLVPIRIPINRSVKSTGSIPEGNTTMNELQQRISLGVGSAAAAAAIYAPLGYRWKGVLTAIAAGTILSGIFGTSSTEKAREIISQVA